jgi:hypothetical protein
VGGILIAAEQMNLGFLKFSATWAFVDGRRIDLGAVFTGTSAKWLLVVHEFHSLYLEIGREGAEVEAEEGEVDKGPVMVAPSKSSLHVGSKMVAIDVETEHGVKMAGDEEAVDGEREFHGSEVRNLLARE